MPTNNNMSEIGDESCVNLLDYKEKISEKDFICQKVIGRGSFGKVYLVKKKNTNNVYAMKVLNKDQVIKKNLMIKTKGKIQYFANLI